MPRRKLTIEEQISRLRIKLIVAEDHRGHEAQVKRLLKRIRDLQRSK